MQLILQAFASILFLSHASIACYIAGTDSGECTSLTIGEKGADWRADNLPYCQYSVLYPACVPKADQELPASREFPNGRWNSTILSKDRTLRKAGVNEYGDKGRVRRRFYKKPDCRNAFRNYMCWINFPRCDVARDLSMPTCRSACENFFISCGYERGLWRCGKSKYFNGYEPEKPIISALGNVSYLREYFPGQPFRENKYSPKGNSELQICTPALDGAASRSHFSSSVLFVALTCVFCLLGVFLQ